MPPTFNIPINDMNTNNEERSNDYMRSSFSVECPDYMAASRTSHEPFHRSSSLGYFSQLPPNHGQKGIYVHNVPSSSGDSIAIHMHNPTDGYKRKQTAMPMMFDEGSTSGSYRGERSLIRRNYEGGSSSFEFNNYTGGSSSNISAHGHHLPKNYALPPQIQIAPWDSLNMGPGCRNEVLLVGTNFQQNGRSHDCYPGSYPLSTLSHNPYPLWHFSAAGSIEQSMPHVVPMGTSRTMLSTGTNTNNGVSKMSASNQSNPTQTRNSIAFFPAHFALQPRVSRVDVNNDRHRVSSFTSNQSNTTTRFVASSLEESDRSGMGSHRPFWNARPIPLPLPIEDNHIRDNSRNNETGSTCPSIEHSAPFHNSWISQEITMNRMDDFVGFLDPHRGMRLNIDNMSYEELLALEERIGDVSTGLSKNELSDCLTVRKYCFFEWFQDVRQEKKCAICLEEYEDRKELGRLNCRHEFHLNCIKTWLQKKDICPICKTSAMTTISKEKHKISS